jgi:ornithine cyclodeaminase/alanine dehydrogenase-like protein (mu-crystallin family)
VAENQQFHFAIEFAAVPFVVLAVHGSGCILHRAAGIEAVDSTMHTLTEDDVRQRLDPERLIAALEAAFRDRYPSTEIPLRMHINLGLGMFLIMPCHDRSGSALGMKLVTVQENPAPPQDRIQATYMVFDPKTASPKLIIPANYLTDVRTAGTSALATKFLASQDAKTLGIFGTGRQARAHLQVLPLVRNFRRALVCGRTPVESEAFAREVSSKIPVTPADASSVGAESDVICTCTTSQGPLFDGKIIRPGTHFNLVGAFQPHTREVDTITVKRSRLYVDTYEACLAEAGDLLIPMKEGVIAREDVTADLHELVAGKKAGRNAANQITLFKSVGCALEDLVAAELLL